MPRNQHQTALITGAGSGMGRAVAASLVGAGLRVALVGRDRSKLEEARSAIGGPEGAVLVEPADVGDRAQVGPMVDRVLGAFGSIDVVVSNAGVNTRDRRLDVLDPAEWDRLININLTGSFNLAHAVLPSMRAAGRGLLIQIASIAGLRANPLAGSAYCASKFGQAALGLCIGREERERGIKSSVIYPGEVETPILDARPVPVSAERRALILQPDDIARAVLFLVDLPPRAHVPELVITPSVDEWA